MSRRAALLFGALVAVAASLPHVRAANDVWDGNGNIPPNNNWSFDPSWVDNTSPGNSDTATFNINDTYTVSFSVNNLDAIQALTLSSGNVTFASTSTTVRTLPVNSATGSQDVSITGISTRLILGASSSNAVNLLIGDDLSVQNSGVLFAQFGSDITASDFSAVGLNGTIVIDSSSSNLTLNGAGINNFIGRSGNTGDLAFQSGSTGNSIAGNLGLADSGVANSQGFMSVLGGATVSLAGNLTMANQNVTGQFAAMGIDGTNSSLTQTGASTITVGSKTNGTASIDIGVNADGGTLTTGTGQFTINATGTVTIGISAGNNTGTLNANGDVVVNGGVLRRNRGTFVVDPAHTMTVQNGGLFDVHGFYNTDAAFVVTGTGSAWTDDSSVSIGTLGTGSLTISTNGDVSDTSASIGVVAGSNGTVTVTGTGSTWTNSARLGVGSGGTGSLTISAHGAVSNTQGSVGGVAASNGSVTVTGAGSTWTNSDELDIGNSGSGTLLVEQGGIVSSSTVAVIGRNAGSNGVVTITGAGSALNASLNVGNNGTGTLTAQNGGSVSGAGGFVGAHQGGDGTMTVTGAGSTWTNSSDLEVGDSPGSIGRLTIAAGGVVSNGQALLGVSAAAHSDAASNGSVTVTGAGSTWTNSAELIIGASGIGAVTIENGGTVSSTTSFIALNGGGNGSASVTGTGSTWTASSLNVGGNATGPGGTGSLAVSSGGLVRVNGITNVWASGNVDVQGAGTFNANDNFTIDDGLLTRASSGSFNLAANKTMTIQNAGRASFTGDYITASNAIYNVSATSSKLETLSGGGISIGNGAQAHVTSGGLVSSAGSLNIGINGSGISGNGTLTVDGTGSSLVSGGASNSWGQSGNTATVTFTNNAAGTLSGSLDLGPATTANTTAAVNVLSGADLSVGGNFTLAAAGGATTSATLNVQGSGSTFSQPGSGAIVVGHASTDVAAINVGTTTSGATFTTGTGDTTINKTGVVTIGNGANTGTFNANGNISVNGGLLRRGSGSSFNLAAGKIMDVFNAGRASFTGGYTTASNAIYFASGGVLETLSSDLELGNGAQVNVDSGGLVSSARFFDIGTTGGDGTLNVSGNSSSVTAAGLSLNFWGNNGHVAHVTFSNNATGSFPGGISMVGSASAGNTADFNILSGADLTVSNLFLGFFGGGAASSATMTVDGAGSSVTQISNSMLSVGQSVASPASLIIRNNSLFTTGAGSIFVAPTGTLELNSGAVLDARGPVTMSGVFNFLGGTLHVDNYTGDLDNQGGTLAPGHSAGNTSISGVYKQQSPAGLQIEIGGTTAGTTFDTLQVGGATVLAGALDVSLISGFTPSAGNAFQIVTAAGGISGQFTSVVLPALSGLVWQLEYQSNAISLFVAIPGDYNHNGAVDAADYIVWRKTLGQTGSALAADGNNNGQIDQGDYAIWRSHFGDTAGSGSGAVTGAAVPEPTTLMPITLVAAVVSMRRRQSA